MTRIFGDPEGGFFYTGEDGERMIVREKVIHDAAIPSSNSVSAMNLLRLGRMTGNPEFEKQADLLIRFFSNQATDRPAAFTHLMQALDFAIGPAREILIAGDFSSPATKRMLETVHRVYFPNRVILLKESGTNGESLAEIAPSTGSITADAGGPTAYVCEGLRCASPVKDAAELASMLRGLSTG
jgi:hypothetical protein